MAGGIATGSAKGAFFGMISGNWFGTVNAAFGGSYTVGRVLADAAVGGASSRLQGGDFWRGAGVSGTFSGLTAAAIEMREAMVAQSRLDPHNATGVSDGFRGDKFKLGGCRWPCEGSPLGGVQGGKGNFLGHTYSSGQFLDHVIEAYAGPHDFLNSPIFYNATGNTFQSRLMSTILSPVNAANVVVATPFVMASITPGYAYGVLNDD